MPSLADLQNVRVGGPQANIRQRLEALQAGGGIPQGGYAQGFGGLQLPQGFGGSNALNIQQVANYQNQLAEFQRQQAANNAMQNMDNSQRTFSMSGGFDDGPKRQMNALEMGLKRGSDFTQGLVSATGWDPNEGFTLGNIMRFGASLPFQMAQGVTEGSEQLYEAATGRPLLQADSETGLIGTNTLDASQRAADLANAAINIGGLFTGGSARAIGTGANILSKGKAGARMAEGMFGRAMKSPAGQVAYDVAEEGGEEFVQQYLDDTRMKQLDEGTFGRALEGAKWGALGGGMMSGGSLALNKALGKTRGANESATAQDGQSTLPANENSGNAQEVYDHYDAFRKSGGDFTGMSSSAKSLNDMISGSRRIVPASTSMKMNYSDSSMDRNTVGLGADDMYASWRSGYDSQKRMAASMKCTEEELTDAMLGFKVGETKFGNRAEALQALMEAKGGEFIVGVGRNPDTKNGGFLMRVSSINEGTGLNLHPWVAPLVGSDWDGDTATVYFDSAATNFIGTPIQMMRDPEARRTSEAASEADWAFSFIDPNLHLDRANIKKIIKDTLEEYEVDEDVLDKVDKWTDEFVEANSSSSDNGNLYADLFSRIESEVTKSNGDPWSGSSAVNTMLNGFEIGVTERVTEHYESLNEMKKEKRKEVYKSKDGVELRGFIESRGNFGDRTVSEILDYIGGVIYTISSTGNPIFRQYSLLKFDAKKHPEWVNALNQISQDQDVFSSLIRTTMRMAANGQSPMTAAEGIIESTIVARTLARWNASGDVITDRDSMDKFFEIYKEEHNRMVAIYEKAQEYATQWGIKTPDNDFLKTPFPESADIFDLSVVSGLLKSFGDGSADILFDTSKFPKRFRGVTINGMVEILLSEDDSIRAALVIEDVNLNNLLQRMVTVKENERNGARSSIEKLVRSDTTSKVLRNALEYKSNGTISLKKSRYQWAFFDYIDSLAQIIDPVIAIRSGLYGLEILDTTIGKMLVSENADTRLNGLVGLSLNTQFEEVRSLIGKEGFEDVLDRKLATLAHVSPLHAAIVAQIRDGNMGLLETLIDPNVSFSRKKDVIEHMKQAGLDKSTDLLDAFITEDSTFATSGISNRVREARSALDMAERDLCISDENDVEGVLRSFKERDIGDSLFMEWFNDLVSTTTVKVDTDLLGHAAYAAQTVHTSQSEKGTNVEPAVQSYASIVISEKGGPSSWLNDLLESPGGVVELDDFTSNGHLLCKVLADKDFRIRVVNSKTGENCFFDRAALIRFLGFTPNKNADLNPTIVFALLKEYPNLAGWISEKSAMPSSSMFGEPGAKISKSKSLSESLNDYVNGKRSVNGTDDLARQMNEIKSFIELKLFNQAWYKASLVAVVASNHDISGNVSPQEYHKWMLEAHNSFVNGILSKIIKGDLQVKSMNGYLSNMFLESWDTLEGLFDGARARLEITFGSSFDSSGYFDSVAKVLADQRLLKKTKEILDGEEISDLFDQLDTSSGEDEDSVIDREVSNTERMLSQSLDAIVSQYESLAGMLAYSLETNPEYTWHPSKTLVTSLESQLDSRLPDGERKTRILDAFHGAIEENYFMFEDLPDFGDVLISPDFTSEEIFDNPRAQKELLDRIIKIIEYDGSPVEHYKNGKPNYSSIKSQIKKIFEKRDLEKLVELRNTYNGIYFSRAISDAVAPGGGLDSVNVNAIRSQGEYVDNLQSFLDEITVAVRNRYKVDSFSNGDVQELYGGYELPVPDFFDKKAEAMGNALKIMDQSGFVPQTVSVNGGMAKKISGFGYLSRDTISPIKPKPIDISRLERDVTDRPREKYVLIYPDREITFEDIRPPHAILAEYNALEDSMKSQVQIGWYNPLDNPHGVYDSHTPLPWSLDPSRYKRASGILARIIDYSQEGMVLKAKKKIQKSAVIFFDRALQVVENRVANNKKLTNHLDAMDALRLLLDDYREDFADQLNDVFQDPQVQDALGFDEEQALILAQLITPGFIVTLKDGTQTVMDVSHVMGDPTLFKATWDKVTGGDINNVTSVEILTVSPEEVSMKISRAVSDYKYEQGDAATEAGIREAADNAMNNWDGYAVNTDNFIHQILSGFRNIGYSKHAMLAAVDWRTPYQYALDEIYGSKYSAYNGKKTDDKPVVYYKENSNVLAQGRSIGRNLFGDETMVFIKTFVPADYKSKYRFRDTGIAEHIRTNSLNPNHVDRDPETNRPLSINGACGLVLDKKLLNTAAEWARETCATLYVDRSIWFQVMREDSYIYGEPIKAQIVSDNQGREYVKIKPYIDAKYNGQYETDLRAGELELDPANILGALIDIDGDYKLGDADCAATHELALHIENVTDSSEVKLSDLFGVEPSQISADKVSIVSRKDAIKIIDRYLKAKKDDPDKNLITFAGLNIQGQSAEMKAIRADLSYFRSVLRGSDSDLAVRENYVHGNHQIIGLAFDGVHYAPIYKPTKAPDNTRFCSIYFDRKSSKVCIDYMGQAGWDNLESVMKVSLDGEAMKMMMHLITDKDIPSVSGVSNIHMIVSANTEHGRIDGMEKNVKMKDIYYLMLKHTGSLLFEEVPKQRGKYQWKSSLNLSETERAGLLSGDRKTWRKVARGKISLLAGNSAEIQSANRAIMQVVENCLRYRIDPLIMLSTYRLKAIDSSSIMRNNSHTRYSMAFMGVRYQDFVNMYHFMNEKFIPAYGERAKKHIMDTDGKTRVVYPSGKVKYVPVRWGVHSVIGDQSSRTTPTGLAKYSPQHMYRRASDYGYLDSEIADAVEYSDFLLGRVNRIRTHIDDEIGRNLAGTAKVDPESEFDVERYVGSSWSELLHQEAKNRIKKWRTKIRRIYDNDEVISNPQNDPRIKKYLDLLRDECGLTNWTWPMFMLAVDRINGYTYDSDEHHQVPINMVEDCLRQLYENIMAGDVPIKNRVAHGKTMDGRYALSRLSRDEIDFFWQSKKIRETWKSKKAFKEAVKKQADSDLEQLEHIVDPIQKKALQLAFEVDYDHWGEYHATGYIANAFYIDDIVQNDDLFARAFGQSAGNGVAIQIDRDTYKNLCDRELQMLSDIQELANRTNRIKWVKISTDERGKRILAYKAEDGRFVSAVLNSLTETSKVMALFNPMVFVSNVMDRGIHQGIMRFALWLGNAMRLGPYKTDVRPPKAEIIERVVNNQYAYELYSAMRLAQLTGEGMEFLANLKTAEEIQNWKKNRLANMGPVERKKAQVFDLMTGSDKMIKGQFRNFLYRFYQFAEATPGQEFWLQEDPNTGLTLFESQLAEGDGVGGAKFLVEVLGGHEGRTPSLTIALQAMNSAQQGDMAQRNVFGMVLSEICRKSPLAKFIVTTTISRFPDYTLNVTGRMLNWILPVSSINYVFTQRLAEHGHNKAARALETEEGGYVDPHYEIAQVHRNLKEAMLVDITHLGVGAVAMILVGMSGGIEPPDDEKKWGNTDEWLVCGMRVGDAWWIEDILGIALPMAAFTKSAQLGKPRMDILVNGVTQACCSNPIIKVADAVGWISDPDGSLISRYDRDYEQYKDAKGGPPGFLDWFNANSIGFGLNWVSQFFTPSCVREWYQNAQQWERSYKRVYQTNPDGSLSEAGKQGYTEYTTYADAQIRRATRRNPFLGFLADLVLNPTTGYMAGEMPMNVYTDDYQRESGEYWSINGLDVADQQAKILEIICKIQSYDSMDDLVATGFYLDSETRSALGSVCWDIINEWDNWYYGLQEDGQLDYYTLGNGDFKTGQEMAGRIKKEWLNQKDAWKSFYYDKVQQLPNSIAKYNRYNTTYEKDVYGNVYASGYRPQGVLPFVSAPGTTTNPEGTAGYENDFMSISSVTGLPLNQRALVPTEAGGEYMPNIEAFSGDGNGSGYSQLYQNWYGDDGTTGEGGTLPSDLANNGLPGSNTGTPTTKQSTSPQSSGGSSKKSSSGSRRSGGGSRRRSGGGGGGGYSSSPSIYARYQAPYAVSANVMGRINHSRPDFDYLRPSWETKGSRESYKREDI